MKTNIYKELNVKELNIKELKNKKETIFIDDFSKEIYEQTYKYDNETIEETFIRVANDIAKNEEKYEYWKEKFLWALKDFKFVPGGRIISNAGTGLKGTTYINCFVDGFIGEDQDSLEGILSALRRQALILKSEGGYGFCADVIRPRGSFIEGIGNETPGSIKMLDMWDTQSSVITEGSGRKSTHKKAKGKIRKGAQMVTMSIWHPDIEEFITAKQTPGKLTKFNMSVLITDEFMTAVKNNQPWNLEFPDIEANIEKYPHLKEKHKETTIKEIYKKIWDGNIKKWKENGLPTKIYKTYENANELWNLIMHSTYTRNEPGVLFIDTINRLNNLYYCEHISATNPCGEQILPIGGVCLLGSINLTQFVNIEKKDWDYEKLKKIIPIIVRFMDNVNDITNVPLKIQKENLKNKRRIGLGIMGYGSALMMMKIKYGSDYALKITDSLMSFITNQAYQASALLAKEKGSFPLFNKELYLKSNFIKKLLPETQSMIEKYGIRNSHIISIQPTGNTSILANVVSGGLEPIFMNTYTRTSIVPFKPENLTLPISIDWENKKFEMPADTTIKWEWIKEGDENLLKTKYDDIIWKIDKSRGLLKETIVKDYGVRFLEERNEWDENAPWAATTTQLTIDEHIKTMKVLSKYVDSSMSKTINIPNNYPYEDFKRVYLELYETGTIKGATTYRMGTMTEVLSDVKKDNKNNDSEKNKIIKRDAVHRPKTLPCDIYHITTEGQKWIVIIGILNNDPYEIFALMEKNIHIPPKFKTGKLTKVKKGRYDLEVDGIIIENITLFFETNEQEALTRMISTALRHGVNIKFIVEQLGKSKGSITSFSKAINRTLKKYIPNGEISSERCEVCGSTNLVYQEGCLICLNCSASKCN